MGNGQSRCPPYSTFGHGELHIMPGIDIGGYIVDLPDGTVKTGKDNNIPKDADADFFYVNNQWYKIKNGTVYLHPSSNQWYIDKNGAMDSFGTDNQYTRIVPSLFSMIYPIDKPPLFWYLYDGNKPQNYINQLHNSERGPLPGSPVPPLKGCW